MAVGVHVMPCDILGWSYMPRDLAQPGNQNHVILMPFRAQYLFGDATQPRRVRTDRTSPPVSRELLPRALASIFRTCPQLTSTKHRDESTAGALGSLAG
jgi:hypothetical protein